MMSPVVGGVSNAPRIAMAARRKTLMALLRAEAHANGVAGDPSINDSAASRMETGGSDGLVLAPGSLRF